MLKYFVTTSVLLSLMAITPLAAQENKQCQLISQLTADYFLHKKEGKSKQIIQDTLRPDFANDEFLRIVDVAIQMAFTFPNELSEQEVNDTVYQRCLSYQ